MLYLSIVCITILILAESVFHMAIYVPIVFIFLPKHIICMLHSIIYIGVWLVFLMPVIFVFFSEHITSMICKELLMVFLFSVMMLVFEVADVFYFVIEHLMQLLYYY